MTKQQPPVESGLEKIPELLPIMPLYDAALFPKMVLPLVVMQKDSVRLVDEAMTKDRMIGLLVSKKSEKKSASPQDDLYRVGTSALILKMAKTEDNKAQLLVQGLSRFEIREFIEGKPYLQARVEHIKDVEKKDKEIEALISNITGQFVRVVELTPVLPQEISAMAKSINEPGVLADMIASTINSPLEEKQRVLEIYDIKDRLKEVTRQVNYQLEILELGNKIQSQVKGDMDKRQREYFLRQQMEAIKEELGEKDETSVELDEYREKIKNLKLTDEARKEAEREIGRIARMHPSSAEYTVALTYLDWLTTLPWDISTKDNLDIKKARKVLDEDHYGLEKAKKRIIEFLAVRKLKPESKGPILCFAGPPGTGKTSLGQSIARALGRKFIRISLGGVRDEAEIRGHRRTYIGALPGRIIQGIKRAGSNNPVFMLDEIDKVGADFRGDPSAALLEVLDPEQNNSFSDHYLEVAFDLSKVMFIATANIPDTIIPALKDRMEIIEIPSYVEEEKIGIAKKFLLPKQIREHGLNPEQISFSEDAFHTMINSYTREAGVRNLERQIATIIRSVAKDVASGKKEATTINGKQVNQILGPIKFYSEVAERIDEPGIVTGLAWTPMGGDILFIEASKMPGKGNLILTGQLGDVMKESAKAAMSYIRAHGKNFNLDENFQEKLDIHVHVPAGAIPKDGPSAGVTLFTALLSLLTEQKVRNDIAMTGEITMRGKILPVGGIKEKVLAAHRAGIRTVILPDKSKSEVHEIPETVRKEIKFIYVKNMDDVVNHAFKKKKISGKGDVVSPEIRA